MQVSLGYDVFRGNPNNANGSGSGSGVDPGLKVGAPIFELSYHQKKMDSAKQYRMPDKCTLITNVVAEVSERTTYVTGTASYTNFVSISARINDGGLTMIGQPFGDSMGFKAQQNWFQKGVKKVKCYTKSCSVFTLAVAETDTPNLTENFEQAVLSLPDIEAGMLTQAEMDMNALTSDMDLSTLKKIKSKYLDSDEVKRMYNDFFLKFGGHYIQQHLEPNTSSSDRKAWRATRMGHALRGEPM